MSLLGKVKLQKVVFKAFSSRDRSPADQIGSFEAMYNPPSFSQKYEIGYSSVQALNSTDRKPVYQRSLPRVLNLKLVLDGTGVDEMGVLQLFPSKTVSERVKDFIDLAFHMNGKIHEPNYLLVEWGGKVDGGLNFSCRLSSVEVTYTSFDRDGSPLRAELNISLISDEAIGKRLRLDDKKSPDLTHTRVVQAGDTLPLLCKEVYGSARFYLRVAEFNVLDNFRSLVPGQTLIFPPLDRAGRGAR